MRVLTQCGWNGVIRGLTAVVGVASYNPGFFDRLTKYRAMQDRNVKPLGLTQSQLVGGWEEVAPLLLVETMKAKKITYKDLEVRLSALGVHESAARLIRKVNRKSFSAAFFFICMSAMGVTELSVPTAQQVVQWFVRT